MQYTCIEHSEKSTGLARANIHGPLDRGMALLQLRHWKFSLFTQRNYVADFIRLKLTFMQKTKKSLCEPPFGGLKVCTRSIARWKVRGRLTLRHN